MKTGAFSFPVYEVRKLVSSLISKPSDVTSLLRVSDLTVHDLLMFPSPQQPISPFCSRPFFVEPRHSSGDLRQHFRRDHRARCIAFGASCKPRAKRPRLLRHTRALPCELTAGSVLHDL